MKRDKSFLVLAKIVLFCLEEFNKSDSFRLSELSCNSRWDRLSLI